MYLEIFMNTQLCFFFNATYWSFRVKLGVKPVRLYLVGVN